jgi:hypothetical protein
MIGRNLAFLLPFVSIDASFAANATWANALKGMKPQLERGNFKKRTRPWYSQFSRSGTITITICPVEL